MSNNIKKIKLNLAAALLWWSGVPEKPKWFTYGALTTVILVAALRILT
jgi:hypothetical protein